VQILFAIAVLLYVHSRHRLVLDERQRLLMGPPLTEAHPAFEVIKASFARALNAHSDRPEVTFPW
jgi:hypothetical protein